MELTNTNIKEELQQYLTENGVKNIWICKKLNLSPTTISLFLKGKRELLPYHLEEISLIIHS
ncbi:MAG TPA: hypothetical protein VIK86_05670 [Candidatus Paceibacterota bacterium]